VNVLLVEDNEDTASALALLFELEGIGFRWTRSGAETLGLLSGSTRHPDVMMLDLTLPDMSGVQLVSQLAGMGSVPPVVLYSAASTDELQRAAQQTGAAAILRKPCDTRSIVQTARAVGAPARADALPA
jgi:DNA-binding response OmpR family regulator